MNITVRQSSVDALKARLVGTARKLKKEIQIAINATGTKAKSLTAKEVTKKVTLKQAMVKKLIKLKRATGDELKAVVSVKKTKQINIKFFKSRQTKVGAVATIYKGGSPVVTPGGFKVSRWKGRFLQRTGKQRGPLKPIKGPSVGEILEDKVLTDLLPAIDAELTKQINRRVEFITKEAAGQLRGKR